MTEQHSAVDEVRVKVSRTEPQAQDTYFVRRTEPMMVLDVLLTIRQDHDPSFAFRHSCRVAVCNVCGVRVDGEPVLACRAAVAPNRDKVHIEPLEGKSVLRDLVVELDQLVDEWEKEGK